MISKEKKAEIIAAYGRNANDTGSPEVQIAFLPYAAIISAFFSLLIIIATS